MGDWIVCKRWCIRIIDVLKKSFESWINASWNYCDHFVFYFHSCVVDSTVKYYPGPQGTRRFSFDTFQFTGQYGSFVYLHCKLVVCNATDPNSRCNVDCFTDFPRRRRRTMEKENSKDVARAGLTEGPFLFRSQKETNKDSAHSEKGTTWFKPGLYRAKLKCYDLYLLRSGFVIAIRLGLFLAIIIINIFIIV